MRSYHLTQADGREYCHLSYDETNRWLQATWKGVVTTPDSHREAAALLRQLPPAPYLLNDNSQVLGPWFDSVDWLQRLWEPRAAQPGPRYVAHVLQPHTEDDLGLLLRQNPFADKFELQFFLTPADAASWLRECQRLDARRPPATE